MRALRPSKLSKKELILGVITTVVVIQGAVMALLVGYVVPSMYLKEEATEYHIKNWSRMSFEPEVSRRTMVLDAIKPKEGIETAPFLVSLSRRMYEDVKSSIEFCCTGTAIAPTLVLTGKDCLHPDFSEEYFLNMIVRSGSQFFSHGGITHSVVKFNGCTANSSSDVSDVYLLEISPGLDKETKFPLMAASSTPKKMYVLGWGGTLVPRHDILYHGRIYKEFWFSDSQGRQDCNSNINNTKLYSHDGVLYWHAHCNAGGQLGVGSAVDREYANGRPLLYKTKGDIYLVGMQCTTLVYVFDDKFPKTYFHNFMGNNIESWLTSNGYQFKTAPTGDSQPVSIFRPQNMTISNLNWARYYYNPGYGIPESTHTFFSGRTIMKPYTSFSYYKVLGKSKRLSGRD